MVCREAAYRAFGGRDVTASRMTEQEKAALLEAVTFVQAAYADGGTPVAVVVDGRPVEFSFLPLTQYSGADLVEYGSYSELLESYYAAKDKAERLRQKSRDLAKTVHNLHERAVRKAAARREEQAQSAASEELRVYGELLSANLWAIQRGAKNVTLTNYYDGKEVTIPLDVRLSPSANAQKYFKEYKKKQTAARMLTELIAESDAEAEYLATVQYEVETAEGEAALAEIRAELKSQGYPHTRPVPQSCLSVSLAAGQMHLFPRTGPRCVSACGLTEGPVQGTWCPSSQSYSRPVPNPPAPP